MPPSLIWHWDSFIASLCCSYAQPILSHEHSNVLWCLVVQLVESAGWISLHGDWMLFHMSCLCASNIRWPKERWFLESTFQVQTDSICVIDICLAFSISNMIYIFFHLWKLLQCEIQANNPFAHICMELQLSQIAQFLCTGWSLNICQVLGPVDNEVCEC